VAKLNSHEQLKQVRKRLSEMGLNKKRKFVHLTCTVCGSVTDVHTNDPSIYTDDVKKNWKCYKCDKMKIK
jgi:hypothetical protein